MLKGVAHVHSTFSFDGKVELRDVRSFFEQKGFDFVMMSEHIEELDLERIREFIDACNRHSSDDCLLIPGIEIDALHILIFGIQKPDSFPDNLAFTQMCYAQGAAIILSHPVKIHHGIPREVEPLLAGVEIWNSRYDGRRAPRYSNLRLLRHMRRRRPELIPFCGIDFHGYSDFADLWIELEADRTAAAIVARLIGGQGRVCTRNGEIPVYDNSTDLSKTLYAARSAFATGIHDGAVALYRFIKGLGLPLPTLLRRAGRRVL
jgi:hypothetical protein